MYEDARHAFRFFLKTLRNEFGTTFVIVLTLALAISANTVIFSFINALLLKQQPGLERPEELVDVGGMRGGSSFDQLSFPNFFDLQKASQVFTGLAAYIETPRSMSFRTSGHAERVWGVPVTGNLFTVLGAKPAAGRFFAPEDEQPGHGLAAVISYSFWERRFGREPSAVGQQVFVNARPVTIVGVAPKGFEGINYTRTDIWTTVVTEVFHTQEDVFNRGNTFVFGIGRLKPGISIEQAQAEMSLVSARLEKEYPADNKDLVARVVPHTPFAVLENGHYGYIGMLFAMALLVLLIACANVSGVCLARSTVRAREVAVRLAIGASRLRVIAQLTMETAALFVAAGLLAVLLALWLNDLVSNLQFLLPFPIAIDLAPDARVAGFMLSLIVLAGLCAGLIPAIYATRVSPASAMKEDPASFVFRPSLLRRALVVAQVAISLLLLVTGGLFSRAVSFAGSMDPGLDANNLEAISLNWFISGYGGSVSGNLPLEPFEKMLLQRVSSLPYVDSASLSVDVPMDGTAVGFDVMTIPDLRGDDDRQGVRNADWNLVSPGYFKTMRISLLRGRDFAESERGGVAIINETMARRYWPGQDPLGRRFYRGAVSEGNVTEVIGIARDTNTRYVGLPAEPMLYAPLTQYSWPQHYLMVRTTDGRSVVPDLRRILLEINPNFPIVSVQSMKDLIGIGLLQQRVGAWVATIMGTVGLILASLGIYGVTAFSVSRRTREIGIRTALGARPMHILSFAFREGVMLALAGIALGWVVAFGLTRLIASFLFGVSPTDAFSFGLTSALLLAMTLLATWIPARRAVRVDPMEALRCE